MAIKRIEIVILLNQIIILEIDYLIKQCLEISKKSIKHYCILFIFKFIRLMKEKHEKDVSDLEKSIFTYHPKTNKNSNFLNEVNIIYKKL